MFGWRKRASAEWLAANEAALRELAGARLAIIEAPNRKMASAEIAGTERGELEKIHKKFGGRIKRLSRDWPSQIQKKKPLKIAKRLVIIRSSTITSGSTSLIIPAGAAFGTGEHVTTAMSLRLLEKITRRFGKDWSMLDLGTGSGILALAATRFGARQVVAIDSDPAAISVAKANARLNRTDGINFQISDARKFSGFSKFEIVSANLYSELLIEILPKLRQCRWLIFSGMLREQEAHFARALHRTEIRVKDVRRRGKWIALLCTGVRVSG